MVTVKVKRIRPEAKMPKFAKEGDVCADLFCVGKVVLNPLERVLVSTGLILEIPEGYEAQIRPKSGIALNKGVTVLNTPGTIESTYRGELKVILYNTNKDQKITFEEGTKIAQVKIEKVYDVEFVEAEEINLDTVRGANGFGSTGDR